MGGFFVGRESEIRWNVDEVKRKIQAGSSVGRAAPLHGVRVVGSNPSQPIEEDWSDKIKALWFKPPKEKRSLTKICQNCGKNFELSAINKKSGKRKFCGNECSGLSTRKIERPSQEVLEKEVKEMGWLGTGRKYGVSDNAIRKWVKTSEQETKK
jgi:hypothetical protein